MLRGRIELPSLELQSIALPFKLSELSTLFFSFAFSDIHWALALVFILNYSIRRLALGPIIFGYA